MGTNSHGSGSVWLNASHCFQSIWAEQMSLNCTKGQSEEMQQAKQDMHIGGSNSVAVTVTSQSEGP